MAIVPLDKMTLYGAESQKDAVIEQLQRLGCSHLVDLGLELQVLGIQLLDCFIVKLCFFLLA